MVEPASIPAPEAVAADLVLGIPVSRLTNEQACASILALARERATPPTYVATVNVDFLVNTLSLRDSTPLHPELADVLRNAGLVTADGMPIVWLARLLGGRLPERVAGSDLVPMLAAGAAKRGLKIYLLGGSLEVAKQAAATLQARNPGLVVAGIDSPFVHVKGGKVADADTDDIAICARIRAADPDLLFVGFGNPKQEIWYARNKHQLTAGAILGIGGTFNFITGRVSRAPAWMQKSGLEWIHRLASEPGRLWKRYTVGLFKFSLMALRALLDHPRPPRTPAPAGRLDVFMGGSRTIRVLRLPKHLDDANAATSRVLDEAEAVVLDARECNGGDAAGFGWLALLWRDLKARGTPALLYQPTPAFERQAKAMKVWDWLENHRAANAACLQQLMPPTGCAWSVRRENGVNVISALGHAGGESVTEVDRGAASLLSSGGKLLIDLSLCASLDANGIVLLGKLARSSDGATILAPHPALRAALAQAGAEEFAEVIDSPRRLA